MYSIAFVTSFTVSEPPGILYSSSRSTFIGHFSFLSSKSISATGASPLPNGTLVFGGFPFGPVLSFICMLGIRS
jgi:hypothetical protein